MKPRIGRQTHVALPTPLEFSWGHAKKRFCTLFYLDALANETGVHPSVAANRPSSRVRFFQFRLKAGVRTGLLTL